MDDSSSKMLVNPGSGWKVLEVTDCFWKIALGDFGIS
jgi:hypothetical protein